MGRDWLRESSGNPLTGRDWVRAPPEAPKKYDDTLDVMQNLANKKINAFSGIGHGFYFWNFRTDLYEPYWSYMLALELGMIPKGSLNDESIINACDREDSSDIICIAKKHAPEANIRGALEYIFDVEEKSKTPEAQAVANMTGDALHDMADEVIDNFFQKYRHQGATCDFGGVGMLVEKSKENQGEGDDYFGNDDEYFGPGGGRRYYGPKLWIIVVCVAAGTFVLTTAGFLIGMRTSKNFNKKVRDAPMFRPIARSHNSLVRMTFDLPTNPDWEEYDEIVKF